MREFKYKVGSTLEIKKSENICGHCYRIGEKVIITSAWIRSDMSIRYETKSLNNMDQTVTEDDLTELNKTTMNTKFDLQKALANPESVLTNNGVKVVQLLHFPQMNNVRHRVLAILDSQIKGQYMSWHYEDGRRSDDADFNLIMKPVTVEKWINIYTIAPGCGYYSGGSLYDTKVDAIKAASESSQLVDTIKITYQI